MNITEHTKSMCFDNEGSNNIYKRLVMRDNMAIGMWIGNGSDNLVLNCDAYRHWDSVSEGGVGGNVDGFGCHALAGSGNLFRGCWAWFNSDDGYDLITANYPEVTENCWAAYNGYDYNSESRGDGNGFKAGGFGGTATEDLSSPIPRHVVRNFLAVGNKQSGFYANHHPGGVTFIGNTALGNKRNFNMLNRLEDNTNDMDGYDHILRNNLGYAATSADLTDVDLAACGSSNNYLELPVISLMRLVSGSDLIDEGVAYGYPFVGDAPDLGAFEYGLSPAGIWRWNYFGGSSNSGDGAGTANPDTDSLVNLLEFACGTNPNLSNAGALTVNGVGGGSTPGTQVVEINITPFSAQARFIRLLDHANSGITYTAQFSHELSTWEDLAGINAVRIPGTSAAGGYEAVELNYPEFLSNGKKARFFRMQINDEF